MSKITAVGNFIGSDKFAKVATGTAGAVCVMTGIKAVGRPIFILKDKNTDEKTKKYAATAEFLYQLICLGITVAMIPFFKTGGLKFAEKYMKNNKEAAKVLDDVSKINIFSRGKKFDAIFKDVKAGLKGKEPEKYSEYEKAMIKGHGGIEAGSFIGSIIGLTMIAPPLSHAIVHPILKAFGMTKDESKPTLEQLQSPAFAEAHHKELDAKV